MRQKTNKPVKGGFKIKNKASRGLKQAHWLCVEYYMQGYSKADAMRKAGYSENMATKRAFRVFDRLDVQRSIEERRWAMRSRKHRLADRIQDELSKLAFFNIGNVLEVTDDGDLIFNFADATMDDLAAIGEVTVETYKEGKGPEAKDVKRFKVKPHDKKAALDSLARIMGMFQDNMNVTSDGQSLEERLQRGRERLRMPAPDVVEGEFTETDPVSRDTMDAPEDDEEPDEEPDEEED